MKINSIQPQYSVGQLRKANNKQAYNNQSPSFQGGVPDFVVNGLSNFYGKTAGTNWFQKFIKNFSKSNNTFTHIMVAESCFLSGFYMLNTLKNKKIKKEQKPQMLLNDAMTLGVSTAGAYLVESKISDVVKKGAENYITKHADFYTKIGKDVATEKKAELAQIVENVVKQGVDKVDDVVAAVGKNLKGLVGEKGKEKAFQITDDALKTITTSVKDAVVQNKGNVDGAKKAVAGIVDDAYNKLGARTEANKFLKGADKLKVLVVFGIIYRYLGPVLITPLANKLSAKFFSHKQEKQADKTQTTK